MLDGHEVCHEKAEEEEAHDFAIEVQRLLSIGKHVAQSSLDLLARVHQQLNIVCKVRVGLSIGWIHRHFLLDLDDFVNLALIKRVGFEFLLELGPRSEVKVRTDVDCSVSLLTRSCLWALTHKLGRILLHDQLSLLLHFGQLDL